MDTQKVTITLAEYFTLLYDNDFTDFIISRQNFNYSWLSFRSSTKFPLNEYEDCLGTCLNNNLRLHKIVAKLVILSCKPWINHNLQQIPTFLIFRLFHSCTGYYCIPPSQHRLHRCDEILSTYLTYFNAVKSGIVRRSRLT